MQSVSAGLQFLSFRATSRSNGPRIPARSSIRNPGGRWSAHRNQTTIAALVSRLSNKTERPFLDKAIRHYQTARADLDDLAVGHAGHKPIHPQYLTKLLSEAAADDAVFTCDVGTPTVWAARYVKMT